jgi:hypothetical protein
VSRVPVSSVPFYILYAVAASFGHIRWGYELDSVKVTFSDGETATAKIIEGFVAYPLPSHETTGTTITVVVQGLDGHGQEITKRGLKTRH